MEPSAYIPAYIEREYAAAHPGLTPSARELVHEQVQTDPSRFATGAHAHALLAYARTRDQLLRDLGRIEELPDDEYDRQRTRLFERGRADLHGIAEGDRLCVDARLVDVLLADAPLDACINDLLRIEREVRGHLEGGVAGFDGEAPHFWAEAELERDGETAAERTVREPEAVGWLHSLEALAQLCLATARYTAAARYARKVMRARGYTSMAAGTLLLALARLEREDEFFAVARDVDAGRQAAPWGPVQDSPWFLLGRVLLLYKTGKRKPAVRALRDFAARCDGGAFFLLNPTYQAPYLPVRPPVKDAWERSRQAVWEADGIISDVPDFAAWAQDVDGIEGISESFAARHGF